MHIELHNAFIKVYDLVRICHFKLAKNQAKLTHRPIGLLVALLLLSLQACI